MNKLPGQKKSKSGGFNYEVDDMSRFRRFLVLGSEGGTYYYNEQELTLENTLVLLRLLEPSSSESATSTASTADDDLDLEAETSAATPSSAPTSSSRGLEVVAEITEFSLSGRAPKQQPLIYSLAICACKGDLATRRAAYAAVSKICRTPTMLFMFMEYCKKYGGKPKSPESIAATKAANEEAKIQRELLKAQWKEAKATDPNAPRPKMPITKNERPSSLGWGRMHTNAIRKWYTEKDVKRLQYLASKYRRRGGWSHRDVLRLTHPRPTNEFQNLIFKYIANDFNWESVREEFATKIKAHQDNATADANLLKKAVLTYNQMEAVINIDNVVKEGLKGPTAVYKAKIAEVDAKWKPLIAPIKEQFKAGCAIVAAKGKLTAAEAKIDPQVTKNKEIKKKLKELNKGYADEKDAVKAKYKIGAKDLDAAVIEDCQTIISKYQLVREQIPTVLLNSPLIWKGLLTKMPMTALLRNLGKLGSVGVLVHGSEFIDSICTQLSDQNAITKARIHPFNVLIAWKVYSAGKGLKGSLSWPVVPAIAEVLENMFYIAFKNTETTNSNIVIGADVSGSMSYYKCAGSEAVTAMEAAVCTAMLLGRNEPSCKMLAFSHDIVPIKNFDPKGRLADLVTSLHNIPMGGTDCSSPIRYANNQGWKEVDCFVILTDNESYSGGQAMEELKKYRKKFNRPNTKLLVFAFSSGGPSVADPNDSNTLDVQGLDSAVPDIMTEFLKGNL